MHTSSTFVVPVYRALTIAGNVLERDEIGDMVHATVVHTTLSELVTVLYEVT